MANKKRSLGFSLVEVAVLMGLVSLFFIPVARFTGGAHQGSTIGKTGTDATRNRMREVTAANTLMEEALIGDLQVPNVNLATLNPNAPFNTGIQEYSNYNRRVFFDWTLLNQSFAVDANGNLLRDANNQPVPLVNGNQIASATLRLYPNGNTAGAPTLVLPTTLSQKLINAPNNGTSNVGIMVVLDTSGSMAWARNDHSLPNTTLPTDPNPLLVSSPYLTYRHAGNNALNLQDNAQLDVVAALQNDNIATPYDETYIPGRGTAAASAAVRMNPGCVASPANNSYFLPEAANPAAPQRRNWVGANMNRLFTYVNNLCNITPTMAASTWQNTVNNNLSRIEAARSALFVFLNRIESNAFLTQSMKLGFETYSTMGSPTSPQPRVEVHSDLQTPQNNRFRDMREWISYLNRLQSNGTVRIPVFGGTPTQAALQTAAQRLYNDNTITDRIIILLTDGVPTDEQGNSISTLMRRLGEGTYTGANGRKITVFSVGLIGANRSKLDQWAQQNRNGGAQGESFFAANVVETMSILDRVADATIRVALNANSCRYNVAVSSNGACTP